jgi:hypothetical protein
MARLVRRSRQIDMGKQRKMVGGITFFPSQLNNHGVLDPDGRGRKNIVQFEPEKIFAKPVKRRDMPNIGISYPKGVH